MFENMPSPERFLNQQKEEDGNPDIKDLQMSMKKHNTK